jgi:hypothetical protein
MDPKDVTLLDRSIPPLDISEKVKRTARFDLDVRLPGTVYAVVAQRPLLARRPLPLRRHQTSVITLKPAIRYQFKTGQRDWPET